MFFYFIIIFFSLRDDLCYSLFVSVFLGLCKRMFYMKFIRMRLELN